MNSFLQLAAEKKDSKKSFDPFYFDPTLQITGLWGSLELYILNFFTLKIQIYWRISSFLCGLHRKPELYVRTCSSAITACHINNVFEIHTGLRVML